MCRNHGQNSLIRICPAKQYRHDRILRWKYCYHKTAYRPSRRCHLLGSPSLDTRRAFIFESRQHATSQLGGSFDASRGVPLRSAVAILQLHPHPCYSDWTRSSDSRASSYKKSQSHALLGKAQDTRTKSRTNTVPWPSHGYQDEIASYINRPEPECHTSKLFGDFESTVRAFTWRAE